MNNNIKLEFYAPLTCASVELLIKFVKQYAASDIKVKFDEVKETVVLEIKRDDVILSGPGKL